MNKFESNKNNNEESWEKFESVDPDNYHFEGIDESLLSESDFEIIDEFVNVLSERDTDLFKVDLDQLWLHLMQYDEELNILVDKNSELQKEIWKYLAGRIEECKNAEARKFISKFNAIAFMRTKLMVETLRYKRLKK